MTVPDVSWADVGALEAVREELQLAILAPVNHREQFDSLGLPRSSGKALGVLAELNLKLSTILLPSA